VPLVDDDQLSDTFSRRRFKSELRPFISPAVRDFSYAKAYNELLEAQRSYNPFLADAHTARQCAEREALFRRYIAFYAVSLFPAPADDLAPGWADVAALEPEFVLALGRAFGPTAGGCFAAALFADTAGDDRARPPPHGIFAVSPALELETAVREMPAQPMLKRILIVSEIIGAVDALGRRASGQRGSSCFALICKLFADDFRDEEKSRRLQVLFRTVVTLWRWEIKNGEEVALLEPVVRQRWEAFRKYLIEISPDLFKRIEEAIRA
jgi:hypothetical protein